MNRRICSLLAVMALISGASISGSQAADVSVTAADVTVHTSAVNTTINDSGVSVTALTSTPGVAVANGGAY